jgi:hypothetical protein
VQNATSHAKKCQSQDKLSIFCPYPVKLFIDFFAFLPDCTAALQIALKFAQNCVRKPAFIAILFSVFYAHRIKSDGSEEHHHGYEEVGR